ncbi:MAG TPA: lysylphosphatidylglycerol synthase domain-containing protein, partial [Ktedonobacterales bacterium]|nr:lysylphosphatidylglycerol synthase domain-containing protein [Ktedonobacterales bacterium]
RPTGPAPGWAQRALRWRWMRAALRELQEFTQGEQTLLHPQIIAVCTLACAVYMVLGGLGLYVVIRGLGLNGITWTEALSASFFSLAVSTIIPVPTDLGSSEASGAGALVAMGLTAAGAVSALLLYRFLNLVGQILVALLAILALPGEFRAMWRARTGTSAAPRGTAYDGDVR